MADPQASTGATNHALNDGEKSKLVSSAETSMDDFSKQRPVVPQRPMLTASQAQSLSRQVPSVTSPPVITEQPTVRSMKFEVTTMDTVSLIVYAGVSVTHKSPAKVYEAVNSAGTQLAEKVSTTTTKLQVSPWTRFSFTTHTNDQSKLSSARKP